MPSISQVSVWIIVGLIGGSIAALAVTRQRAGYGWWRNLAVGLAGAAIGGLVFSLFRIWPELDSVSVSLRDIVAAVCGSLVVLLALWAWRRFRPHSSTGAMVRPRGT